jgi:two-component system sensor histidine kinase ChvG
VNLILVLVPVVGLEFARLYERQLLLSLERDMRNQATLLTQLLLADLDRGFALSDTPHQHIVESAARNTRTRLRVIDRTYNVLIDSHKNGPPEGHEPLTPALGRYADSTFSAFGISFADGPEVPLAARRELKQAMSGALSSATRLRATPPAVLLFLAQPVRHKGQVLGAVYVTRSTQPVLVELHRIRSGLLVVLGLAISSTALVTMVLAWSLTRPIERLARAARAIAAGDRNVELPRGGGGELTELSVALAEMTAQLQSRHRYISEFAADVAHEFKSPLTSIRGAAELLEEGAADDPKTRARFLRNILLDAERLDLLVSRLLELSRIESSDEPLVAVSLNAVIKKAILRCESPDPSIHYSSGEDPYFVLGRSRDLETALLNLLDNALRYSPPNCPIEVAVLQPDKRLEIGVSVRDGGPGISPELKSKVFDRFYTTNTDNGTGLGLAIVASVAAAHGGRVELTSEIGKGSTFTLWLPKIVLHQKRNVMGSSK